jgi:uncharacterized membrane protein required for colicin V production
MDNQGSFQNTPANPTPSQPLINSGQIPLPNSTLILILGIGSIVGCCCAGIIGLISGGVAVFLGLKEKKLYQQQPEKYTRQSYNNMNAGLICAAVGLVFSLMYIGYLVISFIFRFTGLNNFNPSIFRRGYY